MTIPNALGDMNNVHYYQGVIFAQLASTLALYVILKIIHYVIWGADEQARQQKPSPQNKQQPSEQDRFVKKWDQNLWDMYFPIIYTTHMASLSLCLLYIPYIFETVMAYVHLGLFMIMILVNIFIKDEEPGNGNRTTATRVIWALMCITNLCLLIAGLTGIPKVLDS